MMANPLQSPIRLSTLLEGLLDTPLLQDPLVSGVCLDSRKVRPGEVFIALSGSRSHGMDYINEVLQAGASAILLDTSSPQVEGFPGAVPFVSMLDLKQQVGTIAARYYQHPSHKLKLFGITGTNAKTSVCHMLGHSLQRLQKNGLCGVIGTLGNGLYGRLEETLNTTPDAITINQLLTAMSREGARQVVMEVSSHGLQQGRVNGLLFDTAIFTNLTRDHLDYHGDMKTYGRAKKVLFQMPDLRNAVINLDDAFGRELLENLSADVRITGYRMRSERSFSFPQCRQLVEAEILASSPEGLKLNLSCGTDSVIFDSPLIGAINASNLLTCAASLVSTGYSLQDLAMALQTVPVVPGRMEAFSGEEKQPGVIVDYAHTPDGLRQVLTTLKAICAGDLYCVFGCGGDRDQGKRPLMGKIAAELAEHVILTNDNPRSEEPLKILTQIRAGMPDDHPVQVITDRAEAISTAITAAGADDLVLIAGKGHEDYQIIGDSVQTFSDRRLVQSLLGGGDE